MHGRHSTVQLEGPKETTPPCQQLTAIAASFGVVQDEVIHRKVFKIVGAIPAVNYLKVPKNKAPGLGLPGRFLYLQVHARCRQLYVT